jgi:glycerate kinase
MTMHDNDVLDGNVAAGILADVFRADATTAIVTCAGCGASGPMAAGIVYLSEIGLVIRCPQCDEVVLRCAQIRDRLVLDLRGAATVALANPG